MKTDSSPLRRTPVRMTRAISSSDHAPIPVARSEVMFEGRKSPNGGEIVMPPAKGTSP
jgi:hypothetical protein